MLRSREKCIDRINTKKQLWHWRGVDNPTIRKNSPWRFLKQYLGARHTSRKDTGEGDEGYGDKSQVNQE